MSYNTVPTVCNLCGGKVKLKFSCGLYRYECQRCSASVRTNPSIPNMAVGLLGNQDSRVLRNLCHIEFDKKWKGKKNEKAARSREYLKLAKKLNVSVDECHFGTMTLEQLEKAYNILSNS